MTSDECVEESEKVMEFQSKYDLGKQLGTGATSMVHVCTERGLKTPWAVKILNMENNRKVMKAECGILLKLEHKNIIRLKEVFEDKAKMYMILELATGGELFDRIVTRGTYSEKDAAVCLRQILEGVKYLHDNGVVHRDLKPENLLYKDNSEDSLLKIADFGLATVTQEHTKMNMVCGTPGYCAPEVLRGCNYDKSVDLWAVGVILYILLSGYEPFYDDNEREMYKKIVKGKYDFEDPVWETISLNGRALVEKLILLSPASRLTAEQALRQNWVVGTATKANHMEVTQSKLKDFNARRKLKGFTNAVLAANLMRSALGVEKPEQQQSQAQEAWGQVLQEAS